MTIEQLFGTLQQSIVDIWQEHLKTDSYSGHMAMDEYYKDMPELIDQLIENYMGRYGKVLSYENILNVANFTSPVEYLTALRELVSQTYETISASELKSDLDAILSQIDSTVYKLRELTESCEVEFTLEEGAGEPNSRLIECGNCSGGSCKKGTKKDGEEECEVPKKKSKSKNIDKEEEEELREAVISRSFVGKYKKMDREEECEDGKCKKKTVKESLSDYLSKKLK
jgi:hypothetical protein